MTGGAVRLQVAHTALAPAVYNCDDMVRLPKSPSPSRPGSQHALHSVGAAGGAYSSIPLKHFLPKKGRLSAELPFVDAPYATEGQSSFRNLCVAEAA